MNGHSSTAQSAVITMLVGTWQVILVLSKEITPYLAWKLEYHLLLCALQTEKCISLRCMPLVNSMHQCFTVLLTRDPDSIACAGVPMGDVTAGQLSSQVGME